MYFCTVIRYRLLFVSRLHNPVIFHYYFPILDIPLPLCVCVRQSWMRGNQASCQQSAGGHFGRTVTEARLTSVSPQSPDAFQAPAASAASAQKEPVCVGWPISDTSVALLPDGNDALPASECSTDSDMLWAEPMWSGDEQWQDQSLCCHRWTTQKQPDDSHRNSYNLGIIYLAVSEFSSC